jgi:AraC-like DNA-binding protein
LAQLAADAGYADQAHLTRESRRLSGRSPTTLLADEPVAAGDKSVSFNPSDVSSVRLAS